MRNRCKTLLRDQSVPEVTLKACLKHYSVSAIPETLTIRGPKRPPRGVPHLRSGGTPSQVREGVPHLRSGEYPILGLGAPHLKLGATPSQVWGGGGTPSQVRGVPHPRSGWCVGVPPTPGMGYPLPRPGTGYPPLPEMGYPPT